MSQWHYRGEPVDELPEGTAAFVYLITCIDNGRQYLGKKKATRRVTRPPLKGKRYKRRSVAETDWRDYWSSCDELKADVERLGPEAFSRQILILCGTSAEASYHEGRLQFELGVLLSDRFYNRIIQLRIHSNHVKGLRPE